MTSTRCWRNAFWPGKASSDWRHGSCWRRRRPLAEPLDLFWRIAPDVFWRIAPDVFWRIAPDGDSSTADAGAQDHASAGATAIAAGEIAVEIAIADDADIEPARECFVVSR